MTSPTPTTIFEDESLLVISKPAGITVNKADTTRYEPTVQEWAESKLNIKNQISKIEETSDFFSRGGIVHRLDKETSGVLLIAKTRVAFENLQKQFKDRVVKKRYIALAHGLISPEVGEIRVPVGRLPWNRRQFGVIADGREAITKYKVLSSKYKASGKDEMLSLVELYPETGRTHQIRVHLKYIFHPIFSDFLYAGRKTARIDRKLLPRVFLHASKISFAHPTTGNMIEFESVLPEELEETLKKLSVK